MATYTPFEYTRATAPKYDSYEGGYNIGGNYVGNLNQWNQEQNQAQQGAFQGYAQDQFKGLFDMVNANKNQPDPLASLSAAPRYNQYGGTRADFTNPVTKTRQVWDNDANMQAGGYVDQPYQDSVFDQKGYLDARFGNINNYLSNLGSFFGNVGGTGGSGVVVIRYKFQ